MVQLIQMRQQIRAIESIKKITHAMRLISMSGHLQLSHKTPLIENYKNELFKIIDIVQSYQFQENKNLKTNILNPDNSVSPKTLIIIIGSQKGLAGSFNSSLFHFFEKQISAEDFNKFSFITVGKKVTDFIKKHTQPISNYDNFTMLSLYEIADKIFDTIINAKQPYTNIIVYSNYPKSFFAQIPKKQIIVPAKLNEATINAKSLENYIWEQPMDQIYDNLINEYLHFSIQSILFNSLLAEQAARFQSMDNATRNAEELLATLKLQYNKVRQTKITREISELSASLR